MPDTAIDNTISEALDTLTETTSSAIKSLTDRLDTFEAKAKRPSAWTNGGIKAANDNVRFDPVAANDNSALAFEKKGLAEFIRYDTELKSMSASVDTDGGYGVTPELSDDISRRLYDQSPFHQLARRVNVGAFDSYQEPREIGDNTGAAWVTEHESRPALGTPKLGLTDVAVNELFTTQPVTQKLLDDSRFDIASFVMERVADKFARTEGAAFVSGDGLNKPKGFLSFETTPEADAVRSATKLQHVVTGSATDVTFDAVKRLYWSLRAPHRANASFVMSSATASSLDGLKDLEGRYIWRDSAVAGVPPTLLGKSVYFSEDMPAVGAGALPIAFGNWNKGYLIAEKEGIRFLRDPYSSKPNVLFYAYRRVGGGVADFDAIKLLRVAV